MPTLQDYKIVLSRQKDGWWLAYTPAIEGCHALMPTQQEALSELQLVFDMILEEHQEKHQTMPADREIVCA